MGTLKTSLIAIKSFFKSDKVIVTTLQSVTISLFLFCQTLLPSQISNELGPCSPEANGNDVKYVNTTINLKVLLVDFPDIKHNTNPSYTLQNWNDLFFSKGTYFSPNKYSPDGQAVYGSISDYYSKMSNNSLSITGSIINKDVDEDGIPEWIRMKHSKADYNNIYSLDLITDAIEAATAQNLDVDLSKPNTILVIIYAGMVVRESLYLLSPRINSDKNIYIMGEKFAPFAPYNDHRNDSKFAHIGIHVHEIAHCLGLWDLYCDDAKHNNDNGVWDLMASGAYNGPNWSGECPAPINPEMRHRKGWIDYNTIYENSDQPLKTIYSLENPKVYQLVNKKRNEYFLIEERIFNSSMAMDKSSSPDFNSGIPFLVEKGITKGILIWKINSYSPGGQILHSSSLNWTDNKYPPHDVFPGLENVLVFTPWSSNVKYDSCFWSPYSFPSIDIGMEIISQTEDSYYIKLYTSNPEAASPSRPKNVTLLLDKPSKKIALKWSYSDEPDMKKESGALYEISRIDTKRETEWKVLSITNTNTFLDTTYYYKISPFEYLCKYRIRAKDSTGLWSTFSNEATRYSPAVDTTIIKDTLIVRDTLSNKDTLTNRLKPIVKPNSPFHSFTNYPNPFNFSTVIYFVLEKESGIRISLYDLLGKKLTTIIDQHKKKGNYNIPVNLPDYPSGVYFIKLESSFGTYTRKLIIVK